MPFVDYTGTEFVPFLLPIIPKGSRLSEGYNLTPEGIGKVPGLRGQDGRWYGFKGFTKHLCRDDVLPAWARFYQLDKRTETIGCLGRELPLIDQDADHPVIAEIARRRALDVLGPAPVRGRPNSHKFGLLYRLKPGTPFITKKRWVFHDAWDTQYAIEVLGSGEQYVLEGEHPSGVCY